MMTGNDIVAFANLSHRAKTLDQKYLDKLFTGREQTFIMESPDPVLMVATFWAAKESAYKIYYKLTHHRYFAPLHFEVIRTPHIPDPGNCTRQFSVTISTPLKNYPTLIKHLPTFVHAISYDNLSSHYFTLITDVISLPNSDQTTKSHFLKETILKKIATEKGIALKDLSIVKNEWGIPYLSISGHLQLFDLSMSHDGHWGGYTTILPSEKTFQHIFDVGTENR